MSDPIYVTQPYLPPLEEFIPYLEKIWANKILTNGGPFHQQLEQAPLRYATLYDHRLPQSALKSKTPIQTMKDWHQSHPQLFNK